MESLQRSDSRRLYSWWWDSHISPKNSKWLQENLTDMDAKIKTMIRLIEEDADSFARRAEMYYKKRPELMKLVEEFYRAYRALAERYDHATGELRHAHRTMAEAFRDQVPFAMAEDSPSGSSGDKQERHTPEMPHPIHSLLDPDDSQKVALDLASSGLHSLKANGSYSGESDAGFGKKICKQFNEMVKIKEEREQNLASEVLQLSDENQNLKDQVVSESNRAGGAETEIHNLKEALADMHSEKKAILLQYKQSMEKLSNLEGEINLAQMNSRGLDEQARKAAIEVQTLKEALFKLEAERDADFLQHKKLLERISNLESSISKAREDAGGLDERAIRAEIQARYLEKDLSRLESEKDAGLQQYKECLRRISDLEKKLSLAQEEVRLLTEKADRAETEVWKLKRALADLNEEKEAAALQYEHCLKKISKLESELFCAEEDIRRLNNAVLMETAKLKSAEEKCVLLETSNRSLQLEADNLVKRIGIKDLELSKKDEKLEKLQAFVRDEHLQFALVESTLQTLQNLHFQSQADQRSLALELKNGLQILKGLEICKHGLEEEIQKVKDDNRILEELNSSSTISMENLKGEILSLQKIKEKLEDEVGVQISQSNSLQQEIYHLKEEINRLNKRYQALMEQVESVGLNPECIGASVKELMDENTNLRQICKERDEKQVLFKKLDDLEHRLDKNASLEMSLSNLRGELDGSRDKVKSLQESCQLLDGEKSALVAEKAILLSQLQIITETMQKLLEKNFVLENSLSGANVELEGLRAKSNSLEELCKVLNNEKSNLLCERTTLVVQLNNVEQRLQSLEKRFAELEEKHFGLEKEKESTLSQVAELKVSLDVEKQERENFTLSSGPRLASLENHVQPLQEETRWRKKEFEEELDKAVNAQFEIFILRKFIQDMEQKNYSLLIECEKHVKASELTEKLISELEGENLEQQVEAELLLDEIEKLRLGVYKVLRALDIGPDNVLDKIGNDQIFVHHIIENIEDMKCSLWNYEDDRQQLLVENSILLTLVGQLRFEGVEIVSEKKIVDHEFETITKQLAIVQNKEHELLEMNGQLKSEVNKREQRACVLKAEMEKLCAHQGDLRRAYFNLQLEYSQVLEENSYLLKNLLDLKEKNYMVEEEGDLILLETLALGNLAMIFKNFVTEKTVELELLSDDLHKLHGVNGDLAKEVVVWREKLEMKETENLLFKDLVKKLEEDVHYVRDFSTQLRKEILTGKDLLCKKETELSVVEQNHKSTEDLNSELCRTVEGLKMQHEESMLVKQNLEKHILELSEVNMHQNKEIESLHEVNWNLESQLRMLHEEIEEHRIREENMSSELQEMSNEFEIWEAEAATFHFDLQISNIREVLFENKVHELTAICEALANESSSKTVMIEEMKERVALVEAEIGGLKAQLHAFTPAIDCPRDNTVSLEQNIHSRPEFTVADNQELKDVELAVHEKSGQVLMEDNNTVIPNGIPELQDLQARISAVERVITEEMKRLAIQENSNIKLETVLRQMEELKSNYGFSLRKYEQKEEKELGDDQLSDYPKLKKKNPEIFLVRNGILMKEFPLDHISDSSMHGRSRRGQRRADNQVLELWETSGEDCSFDCTFIGESKDSFSPIQAEKELGVDKLEVSTSFSKPNQDQNKRKILERLDSDAQKLKSLQTTVEDLRRKLEFNKNKKKREKNVDIEIVKEQLKEIEETIMQLVEVNGQLSKHVEESSESSDGKASPESEAAENVRRKRVTEQARKGSEKLGRLLLEVQRIEYGLLKLEDEKKSRGKNRILRSRTSVILKNFIYSGRRGSPRHKKACLCGCFRPPTNGEGNMFS